MHTVRFFDKGHILSKSKPCQCQSKGNSTLPESWNEKVSVLEDFEAGHNLTMYVLKIKKLVVFSILVSLW